MIGRDGDGRKYVKCLCDGIRHYQPFKCLECGASCNRAYFEKYVWH
jgi:hypothetical protein